MTNPTRPVRQYDCVAHGIAFDGEPVMREERIEAVDATAAQDALWDKLLAEGWRVDRVDVDEAAP